MVFHSLNIGHRDTRLCPYLVSGNILDLSIGPATVFFPTLLDAPPCLPPTTILDPEVHDALVIQYLTVSLPSPLPRTTACFPPPSLQTGGQFRVSPMSQLSDRPAGHGRLPRLLTPAVLRPSPPPLSVVDYIIAWCSTRNLGKERFGRGYRACWARDRIIDIGTSMCLFNDRYYDKLQ